MHHLRNVRSTAAVIVGVSTEVKSGIDGDQHPAH
jgi:hypothetical protein